MSRRYYIFKPAIVYIFIILINCVSCAETPTSQENFLLTGHSAGPVKIGDSKQDVLKLAPRFKLQEFDQLLEGIPGSWAVRLSIGSEVLFDAEMLHEVVYRIAVNSPKLRTSEGLGIGSTFGDLKKTLGEPKYMSGGEGGFFVVFSTNTGIFSFALDVPVPLQSHVSDTTKVSFILVLGENRSANHIY